MRLALTTTHENTAIFGGVSIGVVRHDTAHPLTPVVILASLHLAVVCPLDWCAVR